MYIKTTVIFFQESLSVHLLRDHEGSKTPWSCNLCKKGFTRKASYEEHINRHKVKKEEIFILFFFVMGSAGLFAGNFDIIPF